MPPPEITTLDALMTDGVLLDLNIDFWAGLKSNSPEDLGILKRDLPGFVVGLGTKRLIPRHYPRKWRQIADRARYCLERSAFRFPVAGASFVPINLLPTVDARLTEYRTEFFQSVDRFLAEYDGIRAKMLAEYPTFAASLSALYPDAALLRDRYRFNWEPYVVALPLQRKRVYMQQLLSSSERAVVARYRETLAARADQFLDVAVRTLRAEAVTLCQGLSTKVASGEIITERTLLQVRRFVDRFRAMNFVGDETVTATLDRLLAEVNGRAAESYQDDETARQALATAFQAVQAAATEITDVSALTGAYRRRIVLDDDQVLPGQDPVRTAA